MLHLASKILLSSIFKEWCSFCTLLELLSNKLDKLLMIAIHSVKSLRAISIFFNFSINLLLWWIQILLMSNRIKVFQLMVTKLLRTSWLLSMKQSKINGEMLDYILDKWLEISLEVNKVLSNFKNNSIKINLKKDGSQEYIDYY